MVKSFVLSIFIGMCVFLSGCQAFTINTTHAETNLRDFAARTKTAAIDCSNQDSDDDNYVTYVVQEPKDGMLIAVECPWHSYNTGCKLSKQYIWTLTPSPSVRNPNRHLRTEHLTFNPSFRGGFLTKAPE